MIDLVELQKNDAALKTCRVITAVVEQDGLTGRGIADATGLDVESVYRIVANLSRQGRIKKTDVPGAARYRYVADLKERKRLRARLGDGDKSARRKAMRHRRKESEGLVLAFAEDANAKMGLLRTTLGALRRIGSADAAIMEKILMDYEKALKFAR